MSSAHPIVTRLHGLGVRLFRLGLLAVVVWMLRSMGSVVEPLTVEQVRDRFPTATQVDAQHDPQAVRDVDGKLLGYVTQTLPDARDVIGYSGPTNTLIYLNAERQVIGLRVLHSDDTPEHVAEVVAWRPFFKQFNSFKQGQLEPKHLDAVTGATLTSTAITEGVLRKLGQQGSSLRFPEPITLEEVKAMEPAAVALKPTKRSEVLEVLDAAKRVIAMVMRTAPNADAVVGYKGPTDTLVLLSADGKTVRGIRLRKSYDTKRYVAYVTDDEYFLKLFNGMTLDKLAALDFKEAKIEGVSGATETSWAVAESLKRRAQAMSVFSVMHWRWQDSGHVVVLLSALAMAFTRLRGIGWMRSLHHLLLVVYVGFVAGEVLSQALFAGWAKHGTPWRGAPGLVLLGVVALLAPVFTRRQLYCHHVCPHGALQQLLSKRLSFQKQLPAVLEHLPMLLLAIVLVAVATGAALNLNALEPFDAYVWKVTGVASLVIAVVGAIASLFVPMAYCRYGCPTGALFKLLRYAGDHDRLGRRDAIALALVLALAGWRFLHG